MTREEVLEMLLEVLDAPTECRVVIDTKLPATIYLEKVVNLDDMDEYDNGTISYLIDKGDDSGEVFKEWVISEQNGAGWWKSSSAATVADFIMNIATSCNAEVYVDGF